MYEYRVFPSCRITVIFCVRTSENNFISTYSGSSICTSYGTRRSSSCLFGGWVHLITIVYTPKIHVFTLVTSGFYFATYHSYFVCECTKFGMVNFCMTPRAQQFSPVVGYTPGTSLNAYYITQTAT
jgi:hypothetical protein